MTRRTIHQRLADARAGLDRVSVPDLSAELAAGAVLVDIRPAAQRSEFGDFDEAVVVERNVLEWRFDPDSGAALLIASLDLRVIVACQEGYTSSLAAADLRGLGIRRATDLAGGYAAWRRWHGRPCAG